MEKGFTIIEIIISIFILSTAVVAIFAAFSVMAILTSDSSDQVTATYLAQEGIEIVRNIRDNNWIKMDLNGCVAGDNSCGYNWNDGLDNCREPGGCKADYTTGTNISGAFSMTPWAHSSSDYLCLDTQAGGFYYQASSCPSLKTKFKRKITITKIEDVDGKQDHIMKVIAQVSWDKKANILFSDGFQADDCQPGKNCVEIETTLYNWYNYINQ